MRIYAIVLMYLFGFTASASSPHLSDDKYYDSKKTLVRQLPCRDDKNCLFVELELGEGSRAREIKRIQKLAARQGVLVRVVNDAKARPRSRVTLEFAGDKKTLDRLAKKISK